MGQMCLVLCSRQCSMSTRKLFVSSCAACECGLMCSFLLAGMAPPGSPYWPPWHVPSCSWCLTSHPWPWRGWRATATSGSCICSMRTPVTLLGCPPKTFHRGTTALVERVLLCMCTWTAGPACSYLTVCSITSHFYRICQPFKTFPRSTFQHDHQTHTVADRTADTLHAGVTSHTSNQS